MRKITAFFVLTAFLFSCIVPPQGFAQTISAVGLMPPLGNKIGLTAAYTPAHLWGMSMNPNDPFKFDFLMHHGDAVLTADEKTAEYAKLIKYFLAALAVPDTDQWVNLSPYEKERVIPDNFGLTEMGRDLLAQDYLLKQLAASLTDPETELGKKFWDNVYAQAHARFGTTDVPTDIFNKVWIMPDKAVVFEKNNTVCVLENHLKVMTEKDYLAKKNNTVGAVSADAEAVADISSQVMKDVILPAIEKEVNEGKSFAPLRQVYSGMLLATWYKRALKESILGKLYADKGKVKGIDQDPTVNQQIYTQYVQAFQKGVFNMIKEDVDAYSQEVIPRKYFSGGMESYEKLSIIQAKQNSSDAQSIKEVIEVVTTAVKRAFNGYWNYMTYYMQQQKSFAMQWQGRVKDFKTIFLGKSTYVATGRGSIKSKYARGAEELADVRDSTLLPDRTASTIIVDSDATTQKVRIPIDKLDSKDQNLRLTSSAGDMMVIYGHRIVFLPSGDKAMSLSKLVGIFAILFGLSTFSTPLAAKDKVSPDAPLIQTLVFPAPVIKHLPLSNEKRERFVPPSNALVVVEKRPAAYLYVERTSKPLPVRTFTPINNPYYLAKKNRKPFVYQVNPQDTIRYVVSDRNFVFHITWSDSSIVQPKDKNRNNAQEISLESVVDASGSLKKEQPLNVSQRERTDASINVKKKFVLVKQLSHFEGINKNSLNALFSAVKKARLTMDVSSEQDKELAKSINLFLKNKFWEIFYKENRNVQVLETLAQMVEFISREDVANVGIDQESLEKMIGKPIAMSFMAKHGVDIDGRDIFYSMARNFDRSDYKLFFTDGVLETVRFIENGIIELKFEGKAKLLVYSTNEPSQFGGLSAQGYGPKFNARQITSMRLESNGDGADRKYQPVLKRGKNLLTDNATGGIDFAQSNLDMQIKRDGAGVVLPVSEQNLENIRIDGLVPEILSIQPVGASLLQGLTTP